MVAMTFLISLPEPTDLKLRYSKFFNSGRTRLVFGILLISLILRVTLILRGGQYYISDETRYQVSRDAAALVLQGEFGAASSELITSPEHLGFKVIGILPAIMEHLVGTSLVMPAMFFSLFSVLDLYLIFLLSQRTSAYSDAPLFALMLAASCLSLLYYSRHLFPYDMAMSFGLLALYTALTDNYTVKKSLACGSLSFLCFITYNGYWTLASFSVLAHVLTGNESKTKIIQKAILTAVGFITPLVLLLLAVFSSGTNMISAYRLFAATITQGSYAEGWSLPLAYFWYTEHTVILVLGGLSFVAGISTFRGLRNNIVLWVGGVLFIYLCLLIPSVFLHYFVVYGRLARQMLPFIAILSAEGLAQLQHRAVPRYKITGLIMAAVFIQAAWNFISSYNLSYPREFVSQAQSKFPGFEFSSKRLAFGAPQICQNNGYMMENAKYFVTPPEIIPAVKGQLLMAAIHPVNFLPYQYDGDPPTTRQIFRSQKLRMKFYKADEALISESNPAWSAIKNCMIHEK
jgi:hypothetical protein